MKILTMCQGGNVRSVACAYILKYKYGIDAIACSWEKNSISTINLLCEWADQIIIMEKSFDRYIPIKYKSKIVIVDVGPDQWFNSLHSDLIAMIDSKIIDINHRIG